MTAASLPDPRDAVAELLRSTLEPDGYRHVIETWPEAPGGRARILIEAGPEACADCLVPEEVMRAVVLGQLPPGYLGELELVYPPRSPSA